MQFDSLEMLRIQKYYLNILVCSHWIRLPWRDRIILNLWVPTWALKVPKSSPLFTLKIDFPKISEHFQKISEDS